MDNLNNSYTIGHTKNSKHLYTTEWIFRTMLGNYLDLKFDKSQNNGGKVLDLGFGDGRNFHLLQNIGLEIYGIEITNQIVDLVKNKMNALNINSNLTVGTFQ